MALRETLLERYGLEHLGALGIMGDCHFKIESSLFDVIFECPSA